jgi:hypothetical protein
MAVLDLLPVSISGTARKKCCSMPWFSAVSKIQATDCCVMDEQMMMVTGDSEHQPASAWDVEFSISTGGLRFLNSEIMLSEPVFALRENTSCFCRSNPKVSPSHQPSNLMVGYYVSRMIFSHASFIWV